MMTPLIDATKVCNICKVEKSIIDYHPNKQCKLGVVGTCKPCYKIRIGAWHSDNRERRQEYANTKNRSRKDEVIDYFGGKCFDCEQSYPRCVYQFHHLDPSKKDVNPSYAMTKRPSAMWEELSKCVMLCANCHMIRHHLINGKEGVHDSTTH